VFFKGSFTFNALSGKVMFRDLSYITSDYSIRVQDGYVIFRWWRAYVPKDVTEGKIRKATSSWGLLFFFRLIPLGHKTVSGAERTRNPSV
jgi:hypothetical protein